MSDSTPELRPRAASPAPTAESSSAIGSPSRTKSPSNSNEEEEVNLEYLRNVILQFLEHKEMRVCHSSVLW